MKALSVRQPWAWCIVSGFKSVENRTWTTKYRGPILIHASSAAGEITDDLEAKLANIHPSVGKAITGETVADDDPGGYVLGAIIGQVNLVGIVEASSPKTLRKACIAAGFGAWYDAQPIDPAKWFIGPVAWLVDSPVQFKDPVDCLGRVSLFTPAEDVLAEVSKRLLIAQAAGRMARRELAAK